jgi:hypothetical protein
MFTPEQPPEHQPRHCHGVTAISPGPEHDVLLRAHATLRRCLRDEEHDACPPAGAVSPSLWSDDNCHHDYTDDCFATVSPSQTDFGSPPAGPNTPLVWRSPPPDTPASPDALPAWRVPEAPPEAARPDIIPSLWRVPEHLGGEPMPEASSEAAPLPAASDHPASPPVNKHGRRIPSRHRAPPAPAQPAMRRSTSSVLVTQGVAQLNPARAPPTAPPKPPAIQSCLHNRLEPASGAIVAFDAIEVLITFIDGGVSEEPNGRWIVHEVQQIHHQNGRSSIANVGPMLSVPACCLAPLPAQACRLGQRLYAYRSPFLSLVEPGKVRPKREPLKQMPASAIRPPPDLPRTDIFQYPIYMPVSHETISPSPRSLAPHGGQGGGMVHSDARRLQNNYPFQHVMAHHQSAPIPRPVHPTDPFERFDQYHRFLQNLYKQHPDIDLYVTSDQLPHLFALSHQTDIIYAPTEHIYTEPDLVYLSLAFATLTIDAYIALNDWQSGFPVDSSPSPAHGRAPMAPETPARTPPPRRPVHPPVHRMLWPAIYSDVNLCDLPPVPRSPTYFDHHTHSYFFGEREADAVCAESIAAAGTATG